MSFRSSRTLLSVLALLVLGAGFIHAAPAARPVEAAMPAARALARSTPLIIDHTTADITQIPQAAIELAKQQLHIGYGHTSHGAQLAEGMSGLIAFANGGGKGLALPQDIFQYSQDGNDGGSSLHLYQGTDGELDGDVGYDGWDDETRAYLGTPNATTGRGMTRPEVNVIIWSWCGQVGFDTYAELAEHYLDRMNQLETEYPGVTFIYMTGHADGQGETGYVHLRNQDIRNYAIANNKVLFDFYDLDVYDPDGNYYGNLNVDDGCAYDGGNWCTEWRSQHTQDVDWYAVGCSHTDDLACNQKAYAAWWLWASLAGWNAQANLAGSAKAVSPAAATAGETVTYTVRVASLGPITNTIQMSDILPAGLSYVAGSLTATGGSVDASAAPNLRWTGVLSPTPVITVTYAATITAVDPGVILNTATITAVGEPSVLRQAKLMVNGWSLFLPLIRR